MLAFAYGPGRHRGQLDRHLDQSMFDRSAFTRLRPVRSRGLYEELAEGQDERQPWFFFDAEETIGRFGLRRAATVPRSPSPPPRTPPPAP